MPDLLNTSSVMMCPHGGTVSAVTGNTRTSVGGAFALRQSDTFIISGCLFTTPVGSHPCVRVEWVQPSTRSQAMGDFTLNEASVGLCVAPDEAVQGTVLIVATQPRVAGI